MQGPCKVMLRATPRRETPGGELVSMSMVVLAAVGCYGSVLPWLRKFLDFVVCFARF
jgi:hypothetical protein